MSCGFLSLDGCDGNESQIQSEEFPSRTTGPGPFTWSEVKYVVKLKDFGKEVEQIFGFRRVIKDVELFRAFGKPWNYCHSLESFRINHK